MLYCVVIESYRRQLNNIAAAHPILVLVIVSNKMRAIKIFQLSWKNHKSSITLQHAKLNRNYLNLIEVFHLRDCFIRINKDIDKTASKKDRRCTLHSSGFIEL